MSEGTDPKRQRCTKQSFDILDLRTDAHDLLDRVYKDLLQVHFPIADELDDLEEIRNNLSKKPDGRCPELHVLVAMFENQPVACCYYEYYPQADFVLMSYICVCLEYRNRGLAKSLMAEVEHQMSERTGGKPVNAFFAETHSVDVDDGVMDAAQRQRVLRSLGFRRLKFNYVQPPLSENHQPCEGLHLLVKDKLSLPSSAILSYLDGFAGSVFDYDNSWKTQQYYMTQVSDLSSMPEVDTTDVLPW
eukprot:TRINITY_DN15936_c0_g1_i1.p1 TRINITY_DN15936_c0_g1~~TRINITY_DN15936_c0_g1_i1.p1  ORF type:complete len:269 (+),score=33.16 TRINITY_DN15936_c0_g1_i1:71-808(+)